MEGLFLRARLAVCLRLSNPSPVMAQAPQPRRVLALAFTDSKPTAGMRCG